MKARLVSLLCLALCGCGGIDVEQRAKAFHAQEAQRRIAAYEEARGQGDLLGMCVKANLVSAAYLDAGDRATRAPGTRGERPTARPRSPRWGRKPRP
jgi:hypothetical protein